MSRRLATAALLLPILIWALPMASGSRFLWGSDFDRYFRPQLIVGRDSWKRDGEIPKWNPFQYAGTPYVGNLQTNPLYPPHWIFLAAPPEEGYEIFVVLHLLAAVWGMYRLMRGFGVSRAGAVISALAYALSSSLLARVAAGHVPNFVTQALAPMWLHLLLRLWKRLDGLSIAALGGWSGLVLAGGTPQWIYHLLLLGTGAALWKSWKGPKRPLLGAIAAALLALLLSAANWLPSIEVTRESRRGQMRSFYDGLHVGNREGVIPPDFVYAATPWFPWADREAKMWDRYWHEKAIYLGILPLLLALAAVAKVQRGPMTFLLIAGCLALLDAMAGFIPLHVVLSWLPGYGKFRVPARVVWIAVLAFSGLAGFGWDLVRSPRIPALLVSIGAVVSGIVFRAPIEAAVSVGLVIASFAAVRWGRPSFALLLLMADLCSFGLAVQRYVPRGEYGFPAWYESRVPDRESYRLLDTTTSDSQYVAHGFRLLNGYGHPILRRTADLYAQAWLRYPGPLAESLGGGTGVADPDILARLNVRWIVTDRPPHPRWREIARNGASVLYEDPDAKPFGGIRRSMNRIDATAGAVSEAWMPGWRATGGTVSERDGLLFVEAPAGAVVHLEYDPPSFRWALRLTLAGVGLLGLLLFWRRA